MKQTRTRHTPAFKAKVALEAVRKQQSVPELARKYGVNANQIYNKWKKQFVEQAALVFDQDASQDETTTTNLRDQPRADSLLNNLPTGPNDGVHLRSLSFG